MEALSKLKPVFDRRYGSVTAGSASPLTAGAAALLLMAEEKAKALGYEPLGFLPRAARVSYWTHRTRETGCLPGPAVPRRPCAQADVVG
nr:hypothetical protein [Corallococcus exiguus]